MYVTRRLLPVIRGKVGKRDRSRAADALPLDAALLNRDTDFEQHRLSDGPGEADVSRPITRREGLVQTSDVVGADRGARVHEDAEVNVVDDGGVADCPNACEGGSHTILRGPRCCIHEKRHSRAGRVLVVQRDNADTGEPRARNP
jgi:hypothetical protein